MGLLSLTNKGLHIKGIGLGDDSLPCKLSVPLTQAMKFLAAEQNRGKPQQNEQSRNKEMRVMPNMERDLVWLV